MYRSFISTHILYNSLANMQNVVKVTHVTSIVIQIVNNVYVLQDILTIYWTFLEIILICYTSIIFRNISLMLFTFYWHWQE